MFAKLGLLGSALLATILGGLLIGFLLKPTYLGILSSSGVPVAFATGMLLGIIFWLFVSLTTLAVFADTVNALVGGERTRILGYLLGSLVGIDGELKRVNNGQITTLRKKGFFASFSTPMQVIIEHGNAVIFERFSKFTRVEPKGFVKTRSLEQIYTILDLKLKHKHQALTLYTKDGIPLQINIGIYFQIHPDGHKPLPSDMYPFSKQAAINAAYAVPDWQEYTMEMSIASLRTIISSRYLYEIYDPLKQLSTETSTEQTEIKSLKDQLQTTLDNMSFDWGVKVTNTDVEVDPPKEIEDQALAFEKARLDQQTQVLIARTENAKIKEFMAETGGTVNDYAILRFCEKLGENGVVPTALEQLLDDSLNKQTSRKILVGKK